MTAAVRFQYGGHATFPVRYGWLPKGVERLVKDGGFVANLETADDLGIGSKMAESLAFWLTAAGLASSDRAGLTPSPLAALIHKRDPYFERPGTWWFIHLLLTRRENTVWGWFFNDYSDRIFDRLGCADAFLQHALRHAVRGPTAATAGRDVACLLSAYAARPGVDVVDPDDIGACPLRELGLVIRHDAVHRFEKARRPSGVPLEVFLAAASHLAELTGETALSARQLATLRHGPGRALCLNLESIETLMPKAASRYWEQAVQTEVLNGERRLLVPSCSPKDWLELLYDRVGAGEDR